LFKKRIAFKKPTTPVLERVDIQTVSSKIDQNRDRSFIQVFPTKEDKYFVVPTWTQDDLAQEIKGRIKYLQYKDQHKPPSYFFMTMKGNAPLANSSIQSGTRYTTASRGIGLQKI
jgi:hypothetical protein